MINEQHLREGLQRLLRDTESAIRERLSDDPSLESTLRDRHAAAVSAGRTAGSSAGFGTFKDEAITQSAVHWLLACVFVRFLEDNGWLDERNSTVAWLSGPPSSDPNTPDRLALAKANRTLFRRPDPNLTDRDYLLHVFAHVAQLPGLAGLFSPAHNPLFALPPTGQGAEKILNFFQAVDPNTGTLVHDFTDPHHGTRFLGDLYQNLSESARKRYALCQTPGFVIDFILDRTLTPALDTFGLDKVRMIDPSCGSGHFLLATFDRLFRLWQLREPVTNPPALAQRALDAVHGVDLNPFAAEISRFRLLIAALDASGITRLRDALDFKIHVAAGDALLHGTRRRGGGVAQGLFEDRFEFYYATEDPEQVTEILDQTYHVVVGNPPYINVSDPVLREAYRDRFTTCHGKYQLGVPFTERFFDLAVWSDDPARAPAGWMGMIVSNAFMKRAFGKKLIEEYLRNKDLTHVIDSSGLNIEGFGTPTVILLGQNQQPITSRPIRAVRGKVGVTTRDIGLIETSPVWVEIRDHTDDSMFEGGRVSVLNASRESFSRHPWAIGGGGASELKDLMSLEADSVVSDHVESVGKASWPGFDDVFVMDIASTRRKQIPDGVVRPMAVGSDVRDWAVTPSCSAIVPYDGNEELVASLDPSTERALWPWRTSAWSVKGFGNRTRRDDGEAWFGWYRWVEWKYRIPQSIVFSEISTHNSFTLTNERLVFDQTAPVIKLSPETPDKTSLSLLGALNSSSGCFWMKQVAHDKGGGRSRWRVSRRSLGTIQVLCCFGCGGGSTASLNTDGPHHKASRHSSVVGEITAGRSLG